MNSIRMRFPGGRAKAFTTSYDDGVEQDIRLISIMRDNGIKGTFNLNSGLFAPEGTVYPEGQVHRRMTLEACKKAYEGDDLEVAVHGYTHPFLETLPAQQCAYEVLEDRRQLEAQFGGIVRGMAYPYGTYNDTVVACLEASGIVYSRTVHSTHSFDIPTDWLRLPATCHHADPELMKLLDRFLGDSGDRNPLLFYLWGHSYEFEQFNNWEIIENFLEKIGGRGDIWYATNIEIYDYVQAYSRLIWSADAKAVKNPTSTEIWFEVDKHKYMVKAGETLTL